MSEVRREAVGITLGIRPRPSGAGLLRALYPMWKPVMLKRYASTGHLSALLLIISGAGFCLGLTMGQWQEGWLWVIPLIVGVVILDRALP